MTHTPSVRPILRRPALAGRGRVRAGAGFTLMEVMLAVVIVAIMSTLVWASFGRLLNVSREIGGAEQFWHGVRLGMNRMAREVSMAFVSDHYDPERYRRDDPEGRPTLFVLEDRGDQDKLTFTAFINRRLYLDEKVSDQALVSYYLDRDDEGETHLYRRFKSVIDEEWERGGESDVLMENVTAFDVQWWDAEDESWEREWDTHDREQHSELPERLRITVTAVDPDGKEQTFTTQTRIKLTRPLTGWAL